MEKDCINAFCFRRLRVPVFFCPVLTYPGAKKEKNLGHCHLGAGKENKNFVL
jgi:hypothetical protein